MGDVELEKFGRRVITSLRDSGIKHFDRLAVGHWKAPVSRIFKPNSPS